MIIIRGIITERAYTQIVRPTERLGKCTPWEDATIYDILGQERSYVLLEKRRGSTYPQRGDFVEVKYSDPTQAEEITDGRKRELILLNEIDILQKAPKNSLERLVEFLI